jgi:predicted PolB exonuclease-like 3'-5' exonuclease
MNYSRNELRHLLFVDIETVSAKARYEEIEEDWQSLWQKKALRIDENSSCSDLYQQKAAIFSEFGRVVAIGMGFFFPVEGDVLTFRVKCLADHDERSLLSQFSELVGKMAQKNPKFKFVAHNGLEFDYPYLCRRMLANGLALPKPLQLLGKKPWEVQHLDTLELWKFGDRKNYTSLDLLAKVFGLPSSKENLDGSKVGHYYHGLDDLGSISQYCIEDVILTARVFLKLNSIELDLVDDNIVYT